MTDSAPSRSNATASPSAEDLRALSWLRKEVQRSIEAAHKAVQRHLREALALRGAAGGAVDPAVLRAARDHLHQAAGALELAGQTEAAMLVRAGEQALHRMVQQPELATGELALVIERAGFALNDYLSRLTKGKPAHTVALFQPYRALLAQTDQARVHPADLWHHDWRWRVISAEAHPPVLAAEASAPEVMERLILRLMRMPDRATLQRMSDLCAALGAEAKGRKATMWRLAAAFFEGQAWGLIQQDVYVKRAASRLLAQLRQGLRPGEVSDQLARDLLFFCACAVDSADPLPVSRLAAVRRAYGLMPAEVPSYESPTLGRTDPAWMHLARKRLSAAREAWAGAVSGEAGRSNTLVECFVLVQESLEKLYPNGGALGQALTRAASAQATSMVPQPALAMEVATAILYLEASLADGELDSPDLPQRIERLAQRVLAVCQGGPPQALDPWMEAVYRRVSDSQTLKSVVEELRGTLGEVERAIDAYFKHPQQRELLAPVEPLLGSLRGVLSVLGLDQATEALHRMRSDVNELALPAGEDRGDKATHQQSRLDRMADNLGALGFLVDILAVQPELAQSMFRFDAQAGVLRAPLPTPQRDEPALAETLLDADSEQAALAQPEAAAAPLETPQPLAPLLPVQPAPPVAPPTLTEPLAPVLPLASGEAEDRAEMLAVFLEESGEVFEQAREALRQLEQVDRDTADDVSNMTAVRRAFHTLKGSSRMVGLQDFGAAAWSCEQLFNARLAQSSSMTPALRSLTQKALDYLQHWTEAIKAEVPGGHEPQTVVAAAEAMRLRDEFQPIPLPQAQIQSQGQDQTQAEAAENIKVIGPLRVEIAMFNIFLNEADELARQLSTQLAEWSHEPQLGPQTTPGEPIESLAHSLAGSSAAVGHAELATLARALEHAIGRSNEAGHVSPGEPQLFARANDDIRRLLHQFAAGFLELPARGLVAELDAHQPQPLVQALPKDSPKPAFAGDLPVLSRVVHPDDDIDVEDAVDGELFANFAEEAVELLPQLQHCFRDWQAKPQDRACAAACMRTLHTYKGAARLVGAMRQGEMAHRLETAVQSLMDRTGLAAAQIEPLTWRADELETGFADLRERVAQVQEAAATDLAAADAGVEAPSAESTSSATVDWAPVLPTLVTPVAGLAAAAPSTGIDWSRFTAQAEPEPARPAEPVPAPVALGAVRVQAALLDRLVNQTGETSMARARLEAELAQVKTSLADLNDNLDRLRRQLRDVEVQSESQISSRIEAAKAAAVEFDPLEMDRYTRVQELTRMMAESVNDVATVQRSLQRALQSGEDQLAMQGRLLRAMQDDLMRTRMVEFESLAERLYRVVRQGAKDTGKQVRLDIVGGAIELDRGVLERMTAPFEHLLRNSLAHGIELPAQRVAAGKNATGLIEIRLQPEGNEVTIELRDDGAGLDLGALRARALAQGLLPADADTSDQAVAELIFAPGLSTANQLSEIAGRGVGMDVVRSEVLAMGGRIQLTSTAGGGMSVCLVLPLTTAVTQVLMLRSGDLQVAVPANLVETVRTETAQAVEAAYREGTVALAGEQVPLFGLASLLGGDAVGACVSGSSPIVFVRSAAQRVAVHVDEVVGDHEVVVKHLGPQLSRLPGLAGMSVLPTGLVTAIYNPVALAACYGADCRRRVQALALQCPPGTPLVAERPQAPLAPLVLVVDDSLTVRRVTQRLLLREGYRVTLAKDGQDALERLVDEVPAVVLSDIEMPRMDGFEFVRRLRGSAAWARLPVIMISSRIAQKHRDVARELGVEHYLGKPYGEEELLAAVAAYTAAPYAGAAQPALAPAAAPLPAV